MTPYSGTQITNAQFKLDEPSGVVLDRTDTTVSGVPATTFFGHNDEIGDTREVWFIHGGFLYEVTTYKELDAWLQQFLNPGASSNRVAPTSWGWGAEGEIGACSLRGKSDEIYHVPP
jgi:hypothetical protein